MDKNGEYELFRKILLNRMRREDETGDEVCRLYLPSTMQQQNLANTNLWSVLLIQSLSFCLGQF